MREDRRSSRKADLAVGLANRCGEGTQAFPFTRARGPPQSTSAQAVIRNLSLPPMRPRVSSCWKLKCPFIRTELTIKAPVKPCRLLPPPFIVSAALGASKTPLNSPLAVERESGHGGRTVNANGRPRVSTEVKKPDVAALGGSAIRPGTGGFQLAVDVADSETT